MAHANPIQIQKYLKGVDYPASKNVLIENARKLGADENVCASLEQLPDEEFQTPAEVSQAFKGPSSDHVDSGNAAAQGNDLVVRAMEDSLAEVELCMLALDISANDDIKEFAQMMIDEHGRFGEELEKLAEKRGLALPEEVTDEHASFIDALSGLKPRDFDRRFMERNLEYHEDGLDMFKQAVAEEKDADLKRMAEKGVSLFTRHLKMVKDVEKKTK